MSIHWQVVKAHRLLLSACSPYFRHLLSDLASWQHPVILLRDIRHADLAGILQFIYQGEVMQRSGTTNIPDIWPRCP